VRECWICFSGGPGLIAPCQCDGSMKWVHRHCLDRWRVDTSNPRNFTHCRHCGVAFQMVLQRPPTWDEEELRERRRRFVRRTISNFLITATALQLALCLLAMAIRAVDQREWLVTFFGLPQIEGTPPAVMGGLWNAVLHHKSTYYLAAVILVLFCVGVTGVAVMCRRCCSSRSRNCSGVDCGSDPCQSYCFFESCGQCSSDCCYFCGRCCEGTECPECECQPSFCSEFGCTGCECGEELGPCAAILLAAIVVVIVAFIIAGVLFALVAAVVWLQKVIVRYMQLTQLRTLTGEYVVRDLSDDSHGTNFDLEQPPLQSDLSNFVDIAPRAQPPRHIFESSYREDMSAVQQSLALDLQAVYGHRAI